MDSPAEPRISVVIPTFNRKNILVKVLRALDAVEHAFPFEVIVVDDGSSDGTFEEASSLAPSYELTVLRQQNSGAGAARNAGAAKARGSLLLFLDDDMIADPQLLIEHDRAVERWDAVVGHIPVDPSAPDSSLKTGLKQWVKSRHERLNGSNSPLLLSDLLTGQLSVKAELFTRLGGFDEGFNAGGTFGAEDTDFLYRLLVDGAQIGYVGTAISYQHYAVTPNQYIRQWAQGGRADAALVHKHPDLRNHVIAAHGGERRHRLLGSSMAFLLPDRVVDAASRRVASRLTNQKGGWFTGRALRELRDALYWRNFDRAERAYANPSLAVLAYHPIGDDASLKPYDTSAADLTDHIETLRAQGYSLISLAKALDFVQGKPLAGPSVLLTFDDGYSSVFAEARRVLSAAMVPAVAFIVSGQIDGLNEWDVAIGRPRLPLMDVAELRELHEAGWAIASHTETHAHLTQLTGQCLKRELEASLTVLTANGFDSPDVLAYPYGENDVRVRRAAKRAGYRFAFAMGGGRPTGRGRDKLRIPRVEVLGGMTGNDLVRAIEAPAAERGAGLVRYARALVRIAVPRFGVTTVARHANSTESAGGPKTGIE